MKGKSTIVSGIAFLLLLFLALGNAFHVSAAEKENTIPKGVYIDEVDIGGMTREEAEAAVENFVEGLKNKGISINVDGNEVKTTLGNLGYDYEASDSIDKALSLGKEGNLIQRYKSLKDIEHEGVKYELSFTIDNEAVINLVKEQASAFNIAPVNASISRKSGKFIYTDHKIGRKVDEEQTAKLISDAILNNWNREDITVYAVVADDMPKYLRDDVEKCKTILGTFTTDYSSSDAGRSENLANGARLLNNTVLYPEDVFSAYEYLTPFTKENGYNTAGAYLNGKIIDSVGGGACQVTTTLYNAALYSELEIVERQAHSMTISYAELSRDAAIAGNYKDLKFRNNTASPILIEAYTKNRKITFNIWGNETRDTKNRRIEFLSVKISETPPPPDVVTEDPNQPITYRKVTQSPHTGYKAELYKIVYVNNVEVSRTLVNKSSYSAEPRYVTIGTKVVEDAEDTLNNGGNKVDDNKEEPPVVDEPLDMAPSIDIYWEESWDDEGFEDENE